MESHYIVVFTALLAFVLHSRIQMEAALFVILCCIASNVLPFAISRWWTAAATAERSG